MFLQLVHIELIRLIRNRSLKVSIPAGLFMILCCIGVALFGVDRMTELNIMFDYDANERAIEVIAAMFLSFYELGVVLLSTVTTIFTTCDYSKFRLAINIEGAERNKFKLCLSEIVGITIFIAVISLLGVPFSILGSYTTGHGGFLNLSSRYEMMLEIMSVIGFFFVISMVLSMTGYFISKVYKSKAVAFTFIGVFVFVYLLLGVTAAGFVRGVNEVANTTTNVGDIVGLFLLLIALVPAVVFAGLLVIKERKRDRI